MAKIEKSMQLLAVVIGHDGILDKGALNDNKLNKELAFEIADECEQNNINHIVIYRENNL